MATPRLKPCEHEPKHAKGLCRKCYSAANNAAYYAANRKAVIKRIEAWARNNPDKRRKIARKVAAKRYDPSRVRQWRRANPDKVKAAKHKRRALECGSNITWTAEEWATLKRQLGFRCVGCGKTETELALLGRKLVPDHIVPLVKGGLNDITNIQPLCHGRGGCNNSKGAKYFDFLIS